MHVQTACRAITSLQVDMSNVQWAQGILFSGVNFLLGFETSLTNTRLPVLKKLELKFTQSPRWIKNVWSNFPNVEGMSLEFAHYERKRGGHAQIFFGSDVENPALFFGLSVSLGVTNLYTLFWGKLWVFFGHAFILSNVFVLFRAYEINFEAHRWQIRRLDGCCFLSCFASHEAGATSFDFKQSNHFSKVAPSCYTVHYVDRLFWK